ncbi:MAG: AAA family ATPase [Patescibacteria group bacterium]
MILVDKITIEEFRGIRNLPLNFKGENFAISGPNGTGKSGVVDALEFGLTGNISRLGGEGTGGISLRKHAPHVDSRDYPEKAKVILELRIPSLGNKRVRLERSVANPNNPLVTPNTPDVLGVLDLLEDRPEFVLSRRELIAYVLAQPGKRSEEIQALLRLDQLGDLRSTLKTISNTCNKEKIGAKKAADEARESLAKGLEIPELKPEKLLEAVNIRRVILGLAPIDTLTNTTILHDGVKTGAKGAAIPKINKVEALADLKTTKDLLGRLIDPGITGECADLHVQLTALNADPALLDSVSREKFLRATLPLIVEPLCPVCDTPWDIPTLRANVEGKLKVFEETGKLRSALERRLEPITDLFDRMRTALFALEKHAKIITPEQVVHLSTYRAALDLKARKIKAFLPLSETLLALGEVGKIPGDFNEVLRLIDAALVAIPEPSQQEAARDYLILCHDRLETYREAMRRLKKSGEHADLAQSVYDIYAEEADKVLSGVYKQVEKEFSEFYRSINSDDESEFSAKLIPSTGKVGFDVDFYGRGHFPPGAYHSEGHQDGMGLCLYLALMQRLQGENFTFAVLDDVLMSVDAGHRREVCKLLKERFPDTQFVLTTHDEVWLKHMGSVGLIGDTGSTRFSNWTPDHGPTEWSNRAVWTEIASALEKDDVRSAAGILRYYSEYLFKDIAHHLRARVEFRGDGRYELGDILSPSVASLRKILADGKKAAESWGHAEDVKKIEEKEKAITEAFSATNADQWLINPAIHYNEWANFHVADFTHVVEAFHVLVQSFCCDQEGCKGLYYLAFTAPKTLDSLRCACGSVNINLKKKPASN